MHDATTMGRRYLSVTLLGVLLYTAEPVAAASLPIPQPWLQQRSAKPRRCLPQLLCIGTQKGGTTSWHDYLLDGYHPRMHVPRARKELHYFDWFVEHNASAQHYFAQFPLTAPGDNPLRDRCAALPRDEDGNVKNEIHVQTEATPRYFFHPLAAQRAYDLLPDTRILLLIRNPIKRIVSHYNMEYQIQIQQGTLDVRGLSKQEVQQRFVESMQNMVSKEVGILRRCYAGMVDDHDYLAIDRCFRFADMPIRRRNLALERIEHVWRSVYADHLGKWMSYFPPERFLIWVSEDFAANPAAHMEQLVAWLGLDTSMANPAVLAKRSYQIPYIAYPSDGVEQELKAFLQPHNQRLFTMLQRVSMGAVATRLQEVWKG